MPFTNATVVPIVIAARLVAQYQRRRVFAERTDRAYESLLSAGGDRVRLNRINAATVADYTIGSDITYTAADVTAIGDLVIDKQKYFAIDIDDIQELQSSPAVLDAAVADAGRALAEQVDSDVRAVFAANGSATAGVAVTLNHSASGGFTANDFGFAAMHRLLDNENVPRQGRFLIVGPYTAECIQTYALQNAVINAPANDTLRNGALGQYAGFSVYVEDDANSNFASNGASETLFYGNDSAVLFAGQIRRVEQIRREGQFVDAVRGLYTYGVKSLDNKRLFKSTATISNIPA